MAYCTWDDIRRQLPETFRSDADIENAARQILAFESRDLDTRLGERYVVPFSESENPEAYDWARGILARIVAARALVIARAQEGGEDEATWFADRLLAAANAAIGEAVNGRRYLSDATLSAYEGLIAPEDGYDTLDPADQDRLRPWFRRENEW